MVTCLTEENGRLVILLEHLQEHTPKPKSFPNGARCLRRIFGVRRLLLLVASFPFAVRSLRQSCP